MSENVYPKASEGGETAHVAPNPSFPDMEETVLDYWDKDDTFQKSVERNPSGQPRVRLGHPRPARRA